VQIGYHAPPLLGKRKEKKRKEKKRKEKKRKEKKRKEKKRKRKEKTTPFGVNLMRSQVLTAVGLSVWSLVAF